MLRSAALALMAVLCAQAVQAQGETRWSLYSRADRSDIIAMASICPLIDTGTTGNYFCISLGCTTGSGLAWRVDFAGAGIVPERVRIQFGIDGQSQTPIPMSRLPEDNAMGYGAAYDPDRDTGIVSALSRGASGVIAFDTPDLNGRTFPLTGAAAALQSTLAQCGGPAAGPAPPPGPTTPREVALAQIARGCGVAPAELRLAPGFETVADITGDGRDDVILNYGGSTCPGSVASAWCGSGGCTHAIWAGQADGSQRQVFNDTIYGLTAGWMPVLTIETHGSTCGGTGASGPCTQSFRIAPDGTMTPLD